MSSAGSDSWVEAHAGTDSDHQAQMVLYWEYRAGGEGSRRAYERLVASLTGMVQVLANDYARKYRIDAEDLLQDARLHGLLPAIDTYDDTKNVRISTYVYSVVRRVLARRAQRYARQRRELILGGGVDGEDESILHLLPVADAELEAEQQEADANLEEVVARALKRLSKIERMVLRLKYGLTRKGREKKDWEIAQRLGKHRSRVSQIAEDARRKIIECEEIRHIACELGYVLGWSRKKRGKRCRRMVALGTR